MHLPAESLVAHRHDSATSCDIPWVSISSKGRLGSRRLRQMRSSLGGRALPPCWLRSTADHLMRGCPGGRPVPMMTSGRDGPRPDVDRSRLSMWMITGYTPGKGVYPLTATSGARAHRPRRLVPEPLRRAGVAAAALLGCCALGWASFPPTVAPVSSRPVAYRSVESLATVRPSSFSHLANDLAVRKDQRSGPPGGQRGATSCR